MRTMSFKATNQKKKKKINNEKQKNTERDQESKKEKTQEHRAPHISQPAEEKPQGHGKERGKGIQEARSHLSH